MEGVYSKFINGKKKSVNDLRLSVDDFKEDRHIQEEFNELNKKLIACE